MQMGDLDGWHLARRRHAVIQQRLREKLTLLVIGELFVQRSTDALRHAADDLAVDNQRIEQRARVRQDGVVEDANLERVAIDLDDGDVQTAGEGCAWCEVVVRRLETRLYAWRSFAGGRGTCELRECESL